MPKSGFLALFPTERSQGSVGTRPIPSLGQRENSGPHDLAVPTSKEVRVRSQGFLLAKCRAI